MDNMKWPSNERSNQLGINYASYYFRYNFKKEIFEKTNHNLTLTPNPNPNLKPCSLWSSETKKLIKNKKKMKFRNKDRGKVNIIATRSSRRKYVQSMRVGKTARQL